MLIGIGNDETRAVPTGAGSKNRGFSESLHGDDGYVLLAGQLDGIGERLAVLHVVRAHEVRARGHVQRHLGLKIVRDNRPFGTIGTAESGTYFIGYTKDLAIIERMLRNMFIGDPEGTTDRILDFSTAQTGSLFFVPTAQFMDDDHPAATS